MFSVRIYSVDLPNIGGADHGHLQFWPDPVLDEFKVPEAVAAASAPSSSTAVSAPSSSTSVTCSSPRSSKPGPLILLNRGIVHLYRTHSPVSIVSPTFPSHSSSTSNANPQLQLADALLPLWRGTLLLVLAVPGRLPPEEFLRFCGPHVESLSAIRVIRNDAVEDRYSVLVKLCDQRSADAFFLDLNGWRFSSSEGEVCHVLFLAKVEYAWSAELAAEPPSGFTELPTCPVCIERLDQDTSGIVATTCDHSYQCPCISSWLNSWCQVCQFCQQLSVKPTCSICGTDETLWICVICAFVGCGRYRAGHAFRHWKDTHHSFSLDLATLRVWDYVGDTYVHRLNHTRSVEKMKPHSKYFDDHGISYPSTDEPEIVQAIIDSKAEAIVEEYNSLLVSQLETQREYYEGLLLESRKEKEKLISKAVDEAVKAKLQDIHAKLEAVMRDNKRVADMNEELMREQENSRKRLMEIEEREKATLALKDEVIRDLEEQIRDFTISIEAQRTIDSMADAHDIKGGNLVPAPSPTLPEIDSSKSRKPLRISKGKR